jgi:hypothetical protein
MMSGRFVLFCDTAFFISIRSVSRNMLFAIRSIACEASLRALLPSATMTVR